ncbi:MAG: DNA repair protein RadA, partial [Bacteroidota bacterium]
WMGRCPNCGSWNSFVEETIKPAPARPSLGSVAPAGSKPERLRDVEEVEASRLKTGVGEFDRVMGGGIVQGSFTLLAGDPGIGKSTLMTEMGRYLQDRRVLYVTGEESTRQVKLRAKRLGLEGDTVYLYAETNVEEIVAAAGKLDPEVMIVDSIQTVFSPQIQSAPGSVSQVRESASALMQLTKSTGIATFVVGHVTKDGQIAGPRVLEHMVDTVLYFEGDRHHAYRILRTVKNRFGSTNEIGLFEMRSTGLREVNNPSEIFLSERSYGASGSAVVCSLEGTRPILVEIQALVSPATYGTPQRTASGFDSRRLQMLLAVLEKRAGLKVSNQDVFLNAAGGVKLEEPAVDLGAIVAVASSLQDVPADSSTVLIGEVGLGGEVRTVSQIERRLSEASKLGFERVVIPKSGHKGLNVPDGLTVIPVRYVREALDAVL